MTTVLSEERLGELAEAPDLGEVMSNGSLTVAALRELVKGYRSAKAYGLLEAGGKSWSSAFKSEGERLVWATNFAVTYRPVLAYQAVLSLRSSTLEGVPCVQAHDGADAAAGMLREMQGK